MSATQDIRAIDVHGHYGVYKQEHVIPLKTGFMTGDARVVVARARRANTEWTIVSPLLGLMPRGKASAFAGNKEAARIVPATDGLRQWVIVNPLEPKTYDQAERMLLHPRCVGIKIHPEEHCYPIRQHGRAIFEFAAKHKAIVLTHSGEKNSLPADCVPFLNDFPEARLILAHLGCGWDGDPTHQVRAIQASKRGNIWVDTSSASNILPGLVEWAVKEIGAERLLYGTDTPLYSVPMQRARIDHAEISDKAKRLILRGNAVKLLGLNNVA
jgi:hypothetical protein